MPRLVPLVLAVVTLTGGSATAGTIESETGPLAAVKKCKRGYKHADIARKHVCVKVGQRCKTKLDSKYHRYGFHCVFGRLRKSHPACSDRRDNDADGKVDLADRGCTSARDPNEAGEPPQADLSLTSADSPDPVVAGSELTYTLTVANAGPDNAADVSVSFPLPAGAALVSASASQGSCQGATATIICSLGALANGGAAAATLVLRPSSPGLLSVTPTTVSQGDEDPNPANNSATATTTVAPPPVCSDGLDNDGDGRTDYPSDLGCVSMSDSTEGSQTDSADVVYTAAVSPSPIVLGAPVTYTLTVTNAGPDPSESISLRTQFLTTGTGLLFVDSMTSTQGTCLQLGGGVRSCGLGDIAAGSSATVTIVLRLIWPAPGDPSPIGPPSGLTLQSGVFSPTPDPTPLNNFIELTVPVIAPVVACGDGLDNDGDGLVDYPADPGCSAATD